MWLQNPLPRISLERSPWLRNERLGKLYKPNSGPLARTLAIAMGQYCRTTVRTEEKSLTRVEGLGLVGFPRVCGVYRVFSVSEVPES